MKNNTGASPDVTQHSLSKLLFLLLTALLCGAMIMVIEVLGSRVIGPFFGVSLFVWTSLITVTLVALALGYAIGGQLADRRGSADNLYRIIFLAGIMVLLIPLYKLAVLKLCVPLGLRLGAFVSSLLLFGPSLFLLGCVSPLLIKVAVPEMKSLGRTVGGFYAISTIGSVLGTVLTGFLLIAYLGVNNIFYLVGMMLCLLSLGYFIILRKRRWVVLVLIPVLLIPLNRPGSLPSLVPEYGGQINVIADNDSYYGHLQVVDYKNGPQHTRDMVIDGLVQGTVDRVNGGSIDPFAYFLTLLPYSINPRMENALVIGLGAGLVPGMLENKGVTTDVVDINPAVFDYAERYFDVRVSGRKVVQDARYFLQSSSSRYDLVVLDVSTGDITPGHLFSLEALELIGQRFSENGILAINLIGDLYDNNYMTASVVRTLEQVFDQVQVYLTVDPEQDKSVANLVLLAYQGEERSPDTSLINENEINRYVRRYVMQNIGRSYQLPEETAAIILTDDYNPIDVFDVSVREEIRKRILRNSEWEILGYSG